jgi:hypothetical protein
VSKVLGQIFVGDYPPEVGDDLPINPAITEPSGNSAAQGQVAGRLPVLTISCRNCEYFGARNHGTLSGIETGVALMSGSNKPKGATLH